MCEQQFQKSNVKATQTLSERGWATEAKNLARFWGERCFTGTSTAGTTLWEAPTSAKGQSDRCEQEQVWSLSLTQLSEWLSLQVTEKLRVELFTKNRRGRNSNGSQRWIAEVAAANQDGKPMAKSGEERAEAAWEALEVAVGLALASASRTV